jgi:hypothetical protein
MEDEGGDYKDRPSCQRFEQWVLSCGRRVRGSKKKPRGHKRTMTPSVNQISTKSSNGKSVIDDPSSLNVFADVFTEDDDLIWPLQLVDIIDREQFRVLYPLMRQLPHAVMYYLHELIFPEVLAHQGLKLSTCGQELGGEMLFGRRIGFSGTPSDILPVELGSCQYERGSDGRVVHYLTSPAVVRYEHIPPGWNARSLLDFIATVSGF